MSEGAAGSAAPAAPASGAPTTAAPAAAAPKDAPAAAPAWGDKDDAELFERLGKSPYGKFKAGKGEFALKSKADFEALQRSHQRVTGVNSALEEAKRERAAAAKERETAEREKALFARARSGDEEAWKELGLVSPADRRAFEENLQALSPEERAIVEENMQLREREAERQRQETAAKTKAEREKLAAEARGIAAQVAKSLGTDKPDSATLRAVAEVMDLSAQAGLDMTPEEIRDYVTERLEGDAVASVAKLPHGRALEKLGDYLRGAPGPELVRALAPVLSKMQPAELFEALGEAALPFARGLSALYVERRRGGARPVEEAPAAPSESAPPAAQAVRTFGLLRPR